MSARLEARQRGVVIATLVLLSWGSLAFGGNYQWAYWPMIVVAAVTGIVGICSPAPSSQMAGVIVAGMTVLLAAVVLQLIPLPAPLLSFVSPHADPLLRTLWVVYAAAPTGSPIAHASSVSPVDTSTAVAFLVSYTLLMLGIARLSYSPLRLLVRGIVCLGIVLALIGIVQRPFFTGKVYGFWEPSPPGSSFGPFINKNHFAGWMTMAIPLASALAVSAASRRPSRLRGRGRWLWWTSPDAAGALLAGFGAALMSAALLLSLSRSGIVSGLAATCLFAWHLFRSRRQQSQIAALAMLAVAAVAALAAGVGLDQLIGRFADGSTMTLSGRLATWQQTMAVIRDFPWTGTGINTYDIVMRVYQTIPGDGHLSAAHNDYLQLAAEGGVLVAAPIVLVVGAVVRTVVRRFEPQPLGSGYWIRVGAVLGLIGIAVQSLADFSLQMPGNSALFAVILGVALHQATVSAK